MTIRALRDWLVNKQPRDLYPEVLVHGGAQIANMIYANGDIAAVIDWDLSATTRPTSRSSAS